MPLTKKGKSILEDFKEQYGEKNGKSFFYAYMKSHPKDTKSWHKLTNKDLLKKLNKFKL